MNTRQLTSLKSIICLLILYLSFASILAQSRISGLVNSSSGAPMEFANILLLSFKDSTFLKGEIASVDGSYVFENVASGEYFCQVSMVGYSNNFTRAFKITTNGEKIDLGVTTLSENNVLQSIEIVEKRALLEQKIDRLVVNVSNTITNAGGNALEVLTRSPGVQVNRLTKSISLVGKEGVVVMINGKISRMPSDAVVQMLESMTSDNIDRIELIHTPPANFEAEGNAGIINIILKTTGDEGFNGSYSLNVGRGRGDKYGGSFNFNFRKKNVNLFGGYDRNYNLNPQVFTNYRSVRQGNDILETDSYSDRSHTPTTGQNARIGVDFQLTKKTVLGVLTTFFDRNWYLEAINSVTYSKNGQLESRLNMPNFETNLSRSYTGNINLTHKFSDNQSINIDADLVRYNINNPSEYMINTINNANELIPEYSLRIDKKTPIDISVIKLDYNLEISDKIKLEAGVKYTKTGFKNNVIVDSLTNLNNWILLNDYTSYSTLKENVSGVFVSISGQLTSKTDFKAGLRREYTNTNLSAIGQPNIVDRHYQSLFPSFFVNHKISEKKSLNLSYSRRITRPGLMQMASFLIFTDPTSLVGGNPSIQPSFTSALKLDYGYNSFRFGISYSIENAPIGLVPSVDAKTNRQFNTFQNLNNIKVANANIYFPWHPTTWWGLSGNIFVNSLVNNFTIESQDFKIQNVNFGFNVNNAINLPKKYSLEVSGNYNSNGYWGVTKWTPTGSFNIGVQKNLGDTWGNLRFAVTDIFLSSNWYGKTNQPEVNLLVDVSFQFSERIFMLSWTNTFGSQKLKSARQRETGTVEEMNRL